MTHADLPVPWEGESESPTLLDETDATKIIRVANALTSSDRARVRKALGDGYFDFAAEYI